MSKKVVLVFVSVLLFSILLSVSYVSANQDENSGSIPIVEVFTDKTVYKINETITIHINVPNPTDSPIILRFTSSHQFDYDIRDRSNNLIYRWSDDKFFLMVLTSITIPAGESYTTSFAHTPQDCSLGPGMYIISGVVVGYSANTTLIEVNGETLPEFPSFDTTPPTISILYPENKTYSVSDVPLTFTVSEPTSWMGCSFDGQNNVTISGNITFVGLSDGSHTIIVYANDATGNIGASEIIYFTIETQQTEPLQLWIVTVIVMIALAGSALLIYFTKVKKTTKKGKQ